MGCGCYATELMFLRQPVNRKGEISRKLTEIFLDRILETSDATYGHQSCLTVMSHTHTHTHVQHTCIKIETVYTCRHAHTCNAKDPPYLHKTEDYQEDNGENDKDHYDNCYGNDNDEYEEHLGSIDSLGKGGGGLIARELSYSV